ncbi:Gustatory receptor 42 [Halyomorpha halys]|nr:Gustatory receptor 42 [Halyomorpha halys]
MGYLIVTFFRRKYRISELVKIFFSYVKFVGSSVVEEVDGQWTVVPSLLAFNFFVSLISSLVMYLTFSQDDGFYDDTYLPKALLLFEYTLLLTSRIVNLFSQVVNLEEIRQIMRSFKALDQIFLNIDSKQLIFQGPPIFFFIANIFITIFCISIQILRMKVNLMGLIQTVHLFYLSFVMNVDIFTVCVLIYSVQVNISYLNSYLETLKSKDCKDGKLHDASVEYCCKGYNELCSQVDHVNRVFGFQLLVVFINIFTALVDELYHLIYLKSSGQFGDDILEVLFLLVSLAYTFFNTFAITSACDKTVVKAKEFNTLLYQVMISDKTSIVSKNKKMRLHASMKREIMFTAYGFFSLDYALVHSIAAAVTTYLVILIQFSQPTPGSD